MSTVTVEAPDGAVALRIPTRRDGWWNAAVAAHGDEPTQVAWRTPHGKRPRYECENHGIGFRPDHCIHLLAATRAAACTRPNDRTPNHTTEED